MMERLIEKIGDTFYIRVGENDLIQLSERPFVTESINKLYLLEQDIKNGLMIKLPCKVGDSVYCIGNFKGILVQKVDAISIDELGNRVCVYNINEHGYCNNHIFYFDDFGKTVFLIKEEAEKALEENKNEL